MAVCLWLVAISTSGVVSRALLPAFSWLDLAIFYLAVSPVAFYARWRGHISFLNTDVVIFLAAPVLFGLAADLLFANLAILPFFVSGVLAALFHVREWFRKSSGELRRPTTHGR